MAKPLEPPPFTAPAVKDSSFMNESWAKWIRDVFAKIKELETRIKELEGP